MRSDFLLSVTPASLFYSQPDGLRAFLLRQTDSTNRVAKTLSRKVDSAFVVTADYQTQGRGTKGRRFYSPDESGLYCSYCFTIPIERLLSITPRAAVAAARAVSDFGFTPRIKWVNDILIEKRKIAGILTESVVQENRATVIIGIGINLYPARELPKELADIYGTVWQTKEEADRQGMLNRLTRYMLQYVERGEPFITPYRQYSAVIGKPIEYLRDGVWHAAVAQEILPDGRLLVQSGGRTDYLLSEEIRFRQ